MPKELQSDVNNHSKKPKYKDEKSNSITLNAAIVCMGDYFRNVRWRNLVRMENGKIAEERDFLDNLDLRQQLGLVPKQ